MKANLDKCHFLCSSNIEVSLTIENRKIKNSKFKKLLGIKLDSLNFNSHIYDICRKYNAYNNTLHGFFEKTFVSKSILLFTI